MIHLFRLIVFIPNKKLWIVDYSRESETDTVYGGISQFFTNFVHTFKQKKNTKDKEDSREKKIR